MGKIDKICDKCKWYVWYRCENPSSPAYHNIRAHDDTCNRWKFGQPQNPAVKTWEKVDPRKKSMKFRCPHCEGIALCDDHQPDGETFCGYRYCPRCGKEVDVDG